MLRGLCWSNSGCVGHGAGALQLLRLLDACCVREHVGPAELTDAGIEGLPVGVAAAWRPVTLRPLGPVLTGLPAAGVIPASAPIRRYCAPGWSRPVWSSCSGSGVSQRSQRSTMVSSPPVPADHSPGLWVRLGHRHAASRGSAWVPHRVPRAHGRHGHQDALLVPVLNPGLQDRVDAYLGLRSRPGPRVGRGCSPPPTTPARSDAATICSSRSRCRPACASASSPERTSAT